MKDKGRERDRREGDEKFNLINYNVFVSLPFFLIPFFALTYLHFLQILCSRPMLEIIQ